MLINYLKATWLTSIHFFFVPKPQGFSFIIWKASRFSTHLSSALWTVCLLSESLRPHCDQEGNSRATEKRPVCSVGLAHLWTLSLLKHSRLLNIMFFTCGVGKILWSECIERPILKFFLGILKRKGIESYSGGKWNPRKEESFLSEYGKVNRFVCTNKGESEKRSFFEWKDFFGGVRKVTCAVFITGLSGPSYQLSQGTQRDRLLWRWLSRKRSTSRFIFLLLLISRPLSILCH